MVDTLVRILPGCFKVRCLFAVFIWRSKSCTHVRRRPRSNFVGSLDNGREIDEEVENLQGKFSSRFQFPMSRKSVTSAPEDCPRIRPLKESTRRLSRGEYCRLKRCRLSELSFSALMLAMAPGNGGGLLGNPWLEGALTRSPLLSSPSENGSEPLAPCFSELFRFISLSSCLRSLRLRFLCSFPHQKRSLPVPHDEVSLSLLSPLTFLLTPHSWNLVWYSRQLQACRFLVMMSGSQCRGLRCGLGPSIFRSLQ